MSRQISLMLDGELSGEAAASVMAHLACCAECRRMEEAFSILRRRIRAYDPPPEHAASRHMLQRILTAPPPPRRAAVPLRPRLVVACAVPLLIFAAAVIVLRSRPSRGVVRPATGWAVARLAGEPKILGSDADENGRLPVGGWLVTDGDARASVAIADIGRIEVAPGSRLRLVGTSATEHRLALERGRISATIYAPPRLFFVDTPSAVAIDYGCAYTLEVDDAGASRLRVTAGWVALEDRGRAVVVPAGASCVTRKGEGPGTPYYDDATERLRRALTELDFGGGEDAVRAVALAAVLGDARRRDSLTLLYLLSRTNADERGRVYDRLATLAPPPGGVTRDGVLRLDEQMLNRWKQEIDAARYRDAA